jgi:hypothetical protein
MKPRFLSGLIGCALLTSGALAQVDLSQRAYSSIATTGSITALSTATQLRYFPMYDAGADILYIGSEATETPFDDYLFSYNFGTSTLSQVGTGTMETIAGLTGGYRVRDYLYAGGRLIVANRDTTPDEIGVINTSTGAGTIVTPSNPLGGGTIRRIAHLNGNIYLVADSSGNINSIDITTGTSSPPSLLTIGNLQGLVAENATDVLVFSTSGFNPVVTRVTNVLTSPAQTNITPAAVSALSGTNWRNFRLGPNGEWIFSDRGSSGAYTLYIWNGTALTTIDDAELAAQATMLGNAHTRFEIPDTAGIAVRPLNANQFQLLIGSRAPSTAVPVQPAVMAITFGTAPAHVEDWTMY